VETYIYKNILCKLQHAAFVALLFLSVLNTGCSKEDDPEPETEGKIIVLMYHRIVNGEASNLYERSLADLEADLNYMKNNDINILTFKDLNTITETGRMPQGNAAIITFDDGDNSWYTLVRPLLLAYNLKATFFLWTNMVGRDSFITWAEVDDMSRYTLPGGEHQFIFGSHTYNHRYLLQSKSEFTNDEDYLAFLNYELGRSKEIIEEHSPISVDILSLPYGDGAGDAEIIDAAKRNGYNYIRTSIWGAIENADQDLYIIPSLPMLDSTEPELIGYYLGLE
jgi:peptidoglycan/xylan/chitin deacetylase (PgdA/CDA1 family)